MGVYYPGYARIRRGMRLHRSRQRALPSFWSLLCVVARLLQVVMGVRLYAREEEDSESFSRSSKFTGDTLEYPEWSFKIRSLIRSKKGNPWARLNRPEPPKLTAADEAACRAPGAARPWESLSNGDDAAKRRALEEIVKKARKAISTKHKNWVVSQRIIFDTLCLSTSGAASQVLQAVPDGDGLGAWNALNKEYGKVMAGDRQLLARRIREGRAISADQAGMIEGDSVKAFCRGLETLCASLRKTLKPSERATCNELSERTLKDVLTAAVTDTYLPIITAQVQLTEDRVTYRKLADALIAHENVISKRRTEGSSPDSTQEPTAHSRRHCDGKHRG